MDRETLLTEAAGVLEKEKRLVRLKHGGKAVFVGDTHGDLEATEEVIEQYLRSPYWIVFLGDYVDRGRQSMENLHTLLRAKIEHPDRLTLLAGNHEGYLAKRFYPANFWESLSDREVEMYGRLLEKLPLAVSTENGVLALHGALPELSSLEEIEAISWADDNWDRVVWGDFMEREGEILGDWGGRPQFGSRYFRRLMDQYGKQLLIRSHQPHAPQYMFNKRCLTIFTSHAYLSTRTIAIVDLERVVSTAADVILKTI